MFKGFQKPKRLVANTETLTDRFGQFTAQPFERGFGSTIGTGLRRVLLSSIEGSAITSVRIEGVAHEFSPIPGVVEDATDIILNLKQVPFKVGRGYVSADRNYDEDLPLGYIPIDSVHSPVRKVNFTVEAARLGQMTDYDKLMIEVWSNGAISPADSVGQAAKLLKDHMAIFINFEELP